MNGEHQDIPIENQEELLDFYQKLRKKINKLLTNRKSDKNKQTKNAYDYLVDYLTVFPDLFHLSVRLLFDKKYLQQIKEH